MVTEIFRRRFGVRELFPQDTRQRVAPKIGRSYLSLEENWA